MDISETCLPERSDNACNKALSCGHYCFGFKNETSCPPCLHAGCGTTGCGQTGTDDCIICYTEQLSEAPIIQVDITISLSNEVTELIVLCYTVLVDR